MEDMKTLKDILNLYDNVNRKKFNDYEIRGSLSELPFEEQQQDAYKFELLAFSLVGNGNDNDWGTYYGPMLTGKKEDGTPAYMPPIESITNEAVLYWESRISQTHNPLMKMQYAGLVWDFKRKVCNDRYPEILYQVSGYFDIRSSFWVLFAEVSVALLIVAILTYSHRK